MTTTEPLEGAAAVSPPAGVPAVDVEIVVPVYNEEAGLEASIRRLHDYLSGRFPLSWTITIVDNASRDRTWEVAHWLTGRLDRVVAVHLDQKGRGRALKAAWSTSTAAVVAYMDVDLSTDLNALLPLVAPLLSGHSDVAIGSRLASGARVARGPKRELISRTYNLILRATLHNGFSDAQCGFKAVRAGAARTLLPQIEDDGWFFDTELLVLAEREGLRIHEVPVDWVDDPDSRVDVATTAREDLKGIWRLLHRSHAPAPDGGATTPLNCTAQLIRFAGIGAVSTAVFAVLFLTLAGPLGPVASSVIALTACSAANLSANRRVTFAGTRARARRRRVLALAASPLALNVAALLVLGWTGVTGAVADVAALTVLNLAIAAGRFGLLRHWIFGAP